MEMAFKEIPGEIWEEIWGWIPVHLRHVLPMVNRAFRDYYADVCSVELRRYYIVVGALSKIPSRELWRPWRIDYWWARTRLGKTNLPHVIHPDQGLELTEMMKRLIHVRANISPELPTWAGLLQVDTKRLESEVSWEVLGRCPDVDLATTLMLRIMRVPQAVSVTTAIAKGWILALKMNCGVGVSRPNGGGSIVLVGPPVWWMVHMPLVKLHAPTWEVEMDDAYLDAVERSYGVVDWTSMFNKLIGHRCNWNSHRVSEAQWVKILSMDSYSSHEAWNSAHAAIHIKHGTRSAVESALLAGRYIRAREAIPKSERDLMPDPDRHRREASTGWEITEETYAALGPIPLQAWGVILGNTPSRRRGPLIRLLQKHLGVDVVPRMYESELLST
jgi:hypothetical protein